jgi:hypothetical protein
MDPKKATAAYPALEKRVRNVLVEQDPSGLYAIGAPDDEHDEEVRRIISLLQRATSVADVREVLKDRLAPWILDAGKSVEDLCTKMAPPIWEAWCEFKLKAG